MQKPLSETEENQCKNAIRMVVDALKTIGFNERTSIQKSIVRHLLLKWWLLWG